MCLAITRSSVPSVSGFASRSRSAAEAVVARGQAESERRRVARGQRHRRDDRERPRKPGALGRGRRAPGALVDEQDVGLLGLDRLLQVAELERGPLTELAEPRAERAEPRPCPPVVGLEPLDLTRQGVRVEPERAQPLDVVDPAAHRDVDGRVARARAASRPAGTAGREPHRRTRGRPPSPTPFRAATRPCARPRPAAGVRSLSSSSRIRSVLSRIALMLRNIHFGGAFSGIRSIIDSKSKLPQPRAARRATSATPRTAAPTSSNRLISHLLRSSPARAARRAATRLDSNSCPSR